MLTTRYLKRVGGRLTYNFHEYVAFDSELVHYPENSSGNFGETQGLFGVRAGKRFGRAPVGLFVKARPASSSSATILNAITRRSGRRASRLTSAACSNFTLRSAPSSGSITATRSSPSATRSSTQPLGRRGASAPHTTGRRPSASASGSNRRRRNGMKKSILTCLAALALLSAAAPVTFGKGAGDEQPREEVVARVKKARAENRSVRVTFHKEFTWVKEEFTETGRISEVSEQGFTFVPDDKAD